MVAFTSIIQYKSVIVVLKLLTTGTTITTVECVREKIKSSLNLLRMETEAAVH